MSSKDDLSGIVCDSITLVDENIDILSDIYDSFSSESELILISDKTELIDMAHEVAYSARIKNAESSFMQRYVQQDH